MERDFTVIQLFDIYGELLTEKQRETFMSYYMFDLSLAEISEPEGKTRQSVYAAVKKVREKLLKYESVLHLYEKTAALNALAAECESYAPAAAEKIREITVR